MNTRANFGTPASARKIADLGRAEQAAVLAQLLSVAEEYLNANPLEALKSIDHVQAILTNGGQHPVRGGLAPWQRRKVVEFVEENLGSAIRIEELARLARLHTSHFTRAFRATFQDSPYNYIIGRRLARAKQMMLETNEPLSFIALECGMSDQAHFSNLFRKFFNTTPNAWRRQYGRGPELLVS